jgi:hypothetical protein
MSLEKQAFVFLEARNSIVGCRAVTMQRPRDCEYTRDVSRQRLAKHVRSATNRPATTEWLLETKFSTWSVQTIWGDKVSSVLYGNLWTEDFRGWGWGLYPVKTVARKRVMITQQSGKGLAGAVVIYELWRLVVELRLLVVPSRVYKWSNKSVHKYKPRL